ncbi:MAG: glutamine synthetase [Parasphingorhabdus sp.]|jgi:glutamine synthetase
MSELSDLRFIDTFIPDINGVLRGKRLPAFDLQKLQSSGLQLPNSVFSTEVTGITVGLSELGLEEGDPDYPCRLVPGTLCRSPWEEGVGQAMFTMLDSSGAEFFADPQTVLSNVLRQYSKQGLRPVLALELEFYLTEIDNETSQPELPHSPVSGARETNVQVYGLTEVWDFKAFLNDVANYCEIQGIDASAASSEYAPGQFEINLNHTDNVMLACAHAIMLKNVVRQTATKHGFCATFMPKPFPDRTGNGCHIHVSVLDQQGDNIFQDEDETGSHSLHQSVAGLLDSMVDCTAIFAPGANSYRRFVKGGYAPTQLSWGVNNRTVAVRIPMSSPAARRIEHRVAGADVNPWLLCACVLGGMLDGINKQMQPPARNLGDAYSQDLPRLPDNWNDALDSFSCSEFAAQILGEGFVALYHGVKQFEHQQFQRIITPAEYQWYLRRI